MPLTAEVIKGKTWKPTLTDTDEPDEITTDESVLDTPNLTATPLEGKTWKDKEPPEPIPIPKELQPPRRTALNEEQVQAVIDSGDLDTAVRVTQGNIAWALQVTKGIDPDTAAKVQKLAESNNLPFDTIQKNPKIVEEYNNAAELLRGALQFNKDGTLKHPYTAAWLSNPENMRVAKDDLKAITELEAYIVAHNRWWGRRAVWGFADETKRVVKSNLASAMSLSFAFAEFAGPPIPEGIELPKSQQVLSTDTIDNLVSEGFDFVLPGEQPEQEDQDSLVEEIDSNPVFDAGEKAKQDLWDDLRNWSLLETNPLPRTKGFSQFALDVVNMLPQVGGAITASLLTGGTPIGAGAFIGSYIYGDTYLNLTEKGVEEIRASRAATANAILQAPLEFIGFSKLLKMLKTSGASNVLAQMLIAMGTEGVTEFLQAFPESATTIWGEAKLRHQTPEEQVAQFLNDVPDTIRQGMYEGTVAATVAFLGGSVRASQQAFTYNRDIKFWEGREKLLEKAKLFERSKTKLGEFVETVSENAGAPDKVFVSPEAINSVFEDNPRDAQELYKKLDITEDQLAEARASGTDVEITNKQWIENLAGTPEGLTLNQDVRFQPDGLNGREYNQLRKNYETVVKEEREAQKKEAEKQLTAKKPPTQIATMRTQLMATKKKGGFGLSAADADFNLNVFMAGAHTLSAKRGESLQAWFDRINPQLVIGGKPVGKQTGAIHFSDTNVTIELFEGTANMSTFLHEVGHIFINDMGSLINAGKGDEQLAADYQTLIDYAGGPLVAENRAGIEKIAKAFEAYLRDGKAPSLKLAQAFRRFRSWLTEIYRSLSQLGMEKTDSEVHQVFDRILASEAEISDAQQYYSSKETIVDSMPEVSKEDKAKVESKKELSEAEALEKRVSQYYRAYLARKGGREELRNQAAALIDEWPVYKAMDATLVVNGFNFSDIEENYGAAIVENIREKNRQLVQKNGQANAAAIAAEFNFKSEDELILALARAEQKQIAIKNTTEILASQIQDEIREDLAKLETIPGDEALHTDAHLSFLIAEMEILERQNAKDEKRRQRQIDQKAITDAAQEIINNKQITEASRYSKYAAAEQRYAKQALEAVKKDDLITAQEAKNLQILNHALIIASVKAREESAKISKRYKSKPINTILNSIEFTYRGAVKDLIKTYKLPADESIELGADDSIVNIKEADPQLYSLIPEWIQTKRISSDPDPKTHPTTFNSWKHLTFKDLQTLNEILKTLIYYGRDVATSMKERDYKTIDEWAQDSISNMEQLKDKGTNLQETLPKFLSYIDGLAAWGLKLEFVFEWLDNFSLIETGDFSALHKGFKEGVKLETKFQDTLYDVIVTKGQPHIQILRDASVRIRKQLAQGRTLGLKNKAFDIPGVPVPDSLVAAGYPRWTTDEILSVMLNLGNTDNLQALKDGYNLTQEEIDLITSLFTKEELKSIQGIWDATETLFPAYDQAYFNLYNRHLKRVEAQSVNLKASDGNITLNGGYYPIGLDPRQSDFIAAKQLEKTEAKAQVLLSRWSNLYRRYTPADSATHERRPGHKIPIKLSLSVWFRHVNDVARYISHAEYIRDWNRLTTHPEWTAMVKKKAGEHVYKEIKKWIQRQAVPGRFIADGPWGRGVEHERQLATVAMLGMKTAVGLKQRLSITSAARELGWPELIDAGKEMGLPSLLYGKTSSEQWEWILSVSDYMRIRTKAFDRDAFDIFNKFDLSTPQFEIHGKTFTSKDVKAFMLEWVRLNDRATVGVVWKAGFNKAMRQNAEKFDMTDEVEAKKAINDAIEKADTVVATTQPSALPLDLARLQASEGMLRMFTMFMTWRITAGNIFRFQYRAWQEGAISNREYFRHILYEALFAAWGNILISHAFYEGELPEWWEFILAPIETITSWIPLVTDVPAYFKYGTEVGTSGVFEGANRILDAALSTSKAAQGKREWSRAAWDVARAIEFRTGIAASNIVRDTERLIRNIEKASK